MKAISIKQPWAWAILHAGKDVENRNWNTNFRGMVFIHVGKVDDGCGREFIKGISELNVPNNIKYGGIIGSVEIVDCVTQSDSKWFFGKFGFVLRNPIELPFVPLRGQLGFFETGIEYVQQQ